MIQRFGKFFLVHIMLILSDTDGFGIDLYQLGKRILQTACDRSRTSLSHVKLWELFRCQLAGRINRCARFVDDVLNRFRNLFEKLYDDLLRLAARSAVSQGDNEIWYFFDQFFSVPLWLLPRGF